MKLQDKELEKAICYKIGEFGDYELQREDLLKVEELNLNNRTFSGKEKDIDLREIQDLSNLKSISFEDCNVSDYSQVLGAESLRVIGDPQFRLKYLGRKENIERMVLCIV